MVKDKETLNTAVNVPSNNPIFEKQTKDEVNTTAVKSHRANLSKVNMK